MALRAGRLTLYTQVSTSVVSGLRISVRNPLRVRAEVLPGVRRVVTVLGRARLRPGLAVWNGAAFAPGRMWVRTATGWQPARLNKATPEGEVPV